MNSTTNDQDPSFVPNADTIRSWDRKTLKPWCQRLNIKMVGTNAELAERIIALTSALDQTQKQMLDKENVQDKNTMLNAAENNTCKKPLKSILKKPKAPAITSSLDPIKQLKDTDDRLPPWTPGRSDDFWVNKMRQKLEEQQAAGVPSPRLEALTKRFERMGFEGMQHSIAKEKERKEKQQAENLLKHVVKTDAFLSSEVAAKTTSDEDPVLKQDNVFQNRQVKTAAVTLVEPAMTPDAHQSREWTASRKNTPLPSMAKQKSPNLEAMMSELNGITDSLDDIPLPPTPPGMSCSAATPSKAPSLDRIPEDMESVLVGNEQSMPALVRMICVVDGKGHALPADQWCKLVLRMGKRWIVDGSHWTRVLLDEHEIRGKDPTTADLLVLEGIDNQTKDKMLNQWDDNFVCQACARENGRRAQEQLRRFDKQITPKKPVHAPAVRSSPTPQRRPASPMRHSPVRNSPRPVNPSPAKSNKGSPRPPFASPLKRPTWNNSTLLKPGASPIHQAMRPASPAMKSKLSGTGSPRVNMKKPSVSKNETSVMRATSSPAPSPVKREAIKSAPQYDASPFCSPSVNETVVFNPRRALMRTPPK